MRGSGGLARRDAALRPDAVAKGPSGCCSIRPRASNNKGWGDEGDSRSCGGVGGTDPRRIRFRIGGRVWSTRQPRVVLMCPPLGRGCPRPVAGSRRNAKKNSNGKTSKTKKSSSVKWPLKVPRWNGKSRKNWLPSGPNRKACRPGKNLHRPSKATSSKLGTRASKVVSKLGCFRTEHGPTWSRSPTGPKNATPSPKSATGKVTTTTPDSRWVRLTNFKKKKAAMVQTIFFDRQGCQVMEYWIYRDQSVGADPGDGLGREMHQRQGRMSSASRRG